MMFRDHDLRSVAYSNPSAGVSLFVEAHDRQPAIYLLALDSRSAPIDALRSATAFVPPGSMLAVLVLDVLPARCPPRDVPAVAVVEDLLDLIERGEPAPPGMQEQYDELAAVFAKAG